MDYGLKRLAKAMELKLLAKMMDETNKERLLKWEYVKTYPGFLGYNRIQKSRARLMAETVQTAQTKSSRQKGNLIIEFDIDARPASEGGEDSFLFYYRETLIAVWFPVRNVFEEPHCGAYEDTPSTRNQRKVAREAVEEFDRAVFGV